MQYQALRTIKGDYGIQHPGNIFDVPDNPATLRRMAALEAKGIVTRYRPAGTPRAAYRVAIAPKAITAYENKAITVTDNKQPSGGPIVPPMRAKQR